LIGAGQHETVAAAIRERVPSTPGVYLFYDSNQSVIYIGKSVDLKKRMLSYFRQKPGVVDRRIGQMIRSIRGFDYLSTRTELQALLMEDELIKAVRPENNVRQNQFEECRYVLLTDDNFPAMRIIECPCEHDARHVFGPYKDRFFAAELLDFLSRHFLIRSCLDPVPAGMCMNHEIGRCSGPCRDAISIAQYGDIVDRVSRFLRKGDPSVTEKITHEMGIAASRRQFEKAAAFKKDLDFCRRFCARQEFIGRFSGETLELSEGIDGGVTHRFDKGRWVDGRVTPPAGFRGIDGISADDPEWVCDPRLVIDRANIATDGVTDTHLGNATRGVDALLSAVSEIMTDQNHRQSQLGL